MANPKVLLLEQIRDDTAARLGGLFPGLTFVDARDPAVRDAHLSEAAVLYGFPPIKRLDEAKALGWIQLLAAGVPRTLCPPAKQKNVTVTNLAGLYGPSIAEHAVCLLLMLARGLHTAMWNQFRGRWDQSVQHQMRDLAGGTLAVVGLGDIGRGIARLAQAHGVRVLGTRRTPRPTPWVDEVYPFERRREMLARADFVALACPLTAETERLIGPADFAAMKPGVLFVNVGRGAVVDEPALLEALRSGHVAGAGLDVFAKEPLEEGHPFWSMPQVIVSPHYSGDNVNLSELPLQRFTRNLRRWLEGRRLEGLVDLDRGY